MDGCNPFLFKKLFCACQQPCEMIFLVLQLVTEETACAKNYSDLKYVPRLKHKQIILILGCK